MVKIFIGFSLCKDYALVYIHDIRFQSYHHLCPPFPCPSAATIRSRQLGSWLSCLLGLLDRTLLHFTLHEDERSQDKPDCFDE
jgi:hypothetical protein